MLLQGSDIIKKYCHFGDRLGCQGENDLQVAGLAARVLHDRQQ
jgi:hypothetical protein